MAVGVDLVYERALRSAAMEWLASFPDGTAFKYAELAAFQFRGERIPLTDRGRGIRKPRQSAAALSFSTTYTPPDQVPPYADEEGLDGLLRYKMRRDSRGSSENLAMRRAMELGLDLIWFVPAGAALYLPIMPVRLMREEQDQFVVALGPEQRLLLSAAHLELDEDQRAYAQQMTSRRLHQPMFRARVLTAYQSRCAMCQLRHASLLDASHILEDRHELGQPVVPNGLALCKIHHAAFDHNIIGIRPDLVIAVREDVLVEIDGPMLRHGIQELAGRRLDTPAQRAARPDETRLEIRYQSFLDAI